MDLKEFYSQREIQKAILKVSKDREFSIMYRNGNFGRRPDIIQYEGDILELIKQGATSFHISEERWKNPLQLKVGMSKKDMDELRKGWDCILDIDCPIWEYSKLCGYLLVEALKYHDLKNISVKFSGNKGFHIGIPFESFPDEVNSKPTQLLFPDGMRVIAAYLSQFIKELLTQKILEIDNLETIAQKTNKSKEEISIQGKFDVYKILDIDTILISSRHLFRAPYSFHEKSQLISLPINPDKIMEFEKKMAQPENIEIKYEFLNKDKSIRGEASSLIIQAFDWDSKNKKDTEPNSTTNDKEYQLPEEAVPEDFFPPCIKIGLKGLEDGKKNFLFIIINFLKNMGWTYQDIEKTLKEWNKLNEHPLSDGYILAQINWNKRNSSNRLPPNCNKQNYYVDMGICKPQGPCSKISNPVNFYKFFNNNQNKKQ